MLMRSHCFTFSVSQSIPYFKHCQVGGDFSNTVITKHMKMFGRVAIIGSISGYNATSPRTGEIYIYLIVRNKSAYIFLLFPPTAWLPGSFDVFHKASKKHWTFNHSQQQFLRCFKSFQLF